MIGTGSRVGKSVWWVQLLLLMSFSHCDALACQSDGIVLEHVVEKVRSTGTKTTQKFSENEEVVLQTLRIEGGRRQSTESILFVKDRVVTMLAWSPQLISYLEIRRHKCDLIFKNNQLTCIASQNGRTSECQNTLLTPVLDDRKRWSKVGETISKINRLKENNRKFSIIERAAPSVDGAFNNEKALIRARGSHDDEKFLCEFLSPDGSGKIVATYFRNADHSVFSTAPKAADYMVEFLDVDSDQKFDFLRLEFDGNPSDTFFYRLTPEGIVKPISDRLRIELKEIGEDKLLRRLRNEFRRERTR